MSKSFDPSTGACQWSMVIDEKGKFRIEYVPTSNPYPIEFIDSMEDDNEDDVVDEDSIVLTTNESEENKLLYVQCTYQSSSEN